MIFKSYWVLLCMLLLFGCTPINTINLSAHPVTNFELVDKRPKEDKETSYGRLEGQYAISKFGDSLFQPDRLSLLKSLLDEKYGEVLRGRQIDVVRLRTLVYHAPRINLNEMINSMHGLSVYPGIPDPSKDWWIFEIAISIDGKLYSKSIAEETPEAKYCPSCNHEIRSKAVVHALNEYVAGFGKSVSLKK